MPVKICIAASLFCLFALALPVHAQTQAERDDKACAEKGAGPDSDDYSACIAQLKMDRFNLAQRRLREMEAMGSRGYAQGGDKWGIDEQTGERAMKTSGLPEEMKYLSPKGTRAVQGIADPQAQMSVTTATVCTREGNLIHLPDDPDSSPPKDGAAKTETQTQANANSDSADNKANCQTTAEVTKKLVQPPPRRDTRDDPSGAMSHNYMHPGDIFHDHTQLGGP